MKTFTMAAMTPMAPMVSAKKLVTPPRVRGDSAKATPMSPARIAVTAKIIPRIAPKLKLRIAEMIEMMEGTLNFFSITVVVMQTLFAMGVPNE